MARRGWLAAGIGLVAVGAAGAMLRRFEIAEASMVPTLEPGDWVLARRRLGVPRRGTVVVFAHPHRPDVDLVKRVIGLPGEEIAVADGRVLVDGGSLDDPWGDGPTVPDGTWSVPGDAVWVLGDNRLGSSSDSRMFGPVAVESIGWEVVARYWPANRVGRVGP